MVHRLHETRKLDITDLVNEMKVSGVTIRKDLKLLEEKNLLFRTKGGASIRNPYANEKPINEKEFINVEQKKKLARAALSLVEQTDAIFIGSGTTVFELSRCLFPTRHFFVITPALKVALELCNRPNVEVIQLGGVIHESSASAAGPLAEKGLQDISCDILFLGVDGIGLNFGLPITNLTKASLNQKMIQIAHRVVIMADSSKFERRGLGRVCDLDQVHCILTEEGVSPKIVKRLKERGVQVMIAR